MTFACWHWSDESVDHARQKAYQRAGEIVQKFLTNQPLNRYGYGDRPLREEVLQSVTNRLGQEVAVMTRNAYGALVLNAARAMFIDIDFSEAEAASGGSLAGIVQGLFGKPRPARPGPEESYSQRVAAWGAQHPELGIRVYRTRAGLRCLITNQLFDPTQTDSANILRELNSDPLYIRLCQAQECFRARLTPKPWRCGIDQPPSSYPWEDSGAENRYRQWEQQYNRTAAQYSTCRFITQLGPATVHPDLEPVLTLHDQIACSKNNVELA